MEDLNTQKPPFYRLGTTDLPETKVDFDIQPVIQPIVQKEVTVKDSQNLTYADLSIKKILQLKTDYSTPYFKYKKSRRAKRHKMAHDG